MAKKTSKKQNPVTEADNTAAPTIAAKTAAKVAARIFGQNPDIPEVHVTSDGTAFYTRNDAQSHAKSLQNREVFSIKRSTAMTVPTTVKAATASKTTPVADDDVDELTGEFVSDEPSNTDE